MAGMPGRTPTTGAMHSTPSAVGAASRAAARPELFDNPESKLRYEAYRCDCVRYEAFSRLQAAAVAFGETLPIPEIVAIGGQSDGKSTLLEAFLGFRFNVKEVELGTRRPLIVQMVHDPTALEPRCRLQNEDSEEYGPVIMPETAVADAISRRTQEHLRKLGGATVSAKPIVMRAEYAFCPNLTIIDTPGFILKAREGEADSTPDDILRMVKEQAAPPHRLILFLQQSSVEWASSLWLHVVQAVDPQLQRTVIVASKFDNRLKEFSERWEVDSYLGASGYLPPGVKPFFIALPKERSIATSEAWRKAMAETDASILKHMREAIKGGFDEERFGSRVGFGNLKRFLEGELARRYRESAPGTLSLLQERCDQVAAELAAAEVRLKAAGDVGALRKAAMQYASALSQQIQALLNGATEPDPARHGMTSDDERAASRVPQWPGIAAAIKPPNAGLRLFGGAAFERCLNEFQEAAHALRFPSAVASEKVANVLLAYKGKNSFGGAARAAEDIARQAARELLGPLLDTACSRLCFVLRRTFDIAFEHLTLTACSAAADNLQPYVNFHACLRSAHHSFLARLEETCKTLVRHHLDSATSEFAVNLLVASAAAWAADEEEIENVPPPTAHDGDAAAFVAVADADGTGAAAGVRRAAAVPIPASQMTIPETPTPEAMAMAAAETAPLNKRHALAGRHIDANSPSKGRAAKAARLMDASSGSGVAGNPLYNGRGTYEDVLRYADRLFGRIRQAVACQAAPATLKSAFLDPLKENLCLEVSLELFARPDADFLSMFTAPGALNALSAKRDVLSRRAEGLVKCKNEFAELARCL